MLEIAVKSPEIIETPNVDPQTSTVETQHSSPEAQTQNQPPKPEVQTPEAKPQTTPVELQSLNVSALSLKSIRAKKELEQITKANAKEEVHLPTEPFNETDMLLQWTKFAQRLSDRGHKIMESLMLIATPKLEGTTIVHELPNDGARIDFESGKHELVGYLRGKLHNHDIDIKTLVNESIDSRKAFTPQDRFNRLNEINPSLELLRKTFDLDF